MTKLKKDLSLTYLEVEPADTTASAPLVVVLHGRGSDASDLAAIAPQIDGLHQYRCVFPNAPSLFEMMPGYSRGYSWFDGWPAEKMSFHRSRLLLSTFLEELHERFGTEPSQTALLGFSQGAMMSADVGLRSNENLAAIVVMSGAIHESELPDLSMKRDQKLMIVHGTSDDVIPVMAARRARAILLEKNLNPEYHEFSMGHWVTEESMEVVAEFLHSALTPSSTK